jgi:WD40 repeat protein
VPLSSPARPRIAGVLHHFNGKHKSTSGVSGPSAGQPLASTAFDGHKHHLGVCDVVSGERLFSADGGALAYSPDGATLASGSGDFTVRLWDTAPLKARYQARFVNWSNRRGDPRVKRMYRLCR